MAGRATASIMLLAVGALLGVGFAAWAAEPANPAAGGNEAADRAACTAEARAIATRSEPSTLSLTDAHGRRAEGLIGTIAGGRFPGLYASKRERDQYRLCMYRRGWSNTDGPANTEQ